MKKPIRTYVYLVNYFEDCTAHNVQRQPNIGSHTATVRLVLCFLLKITNIYPIKTEMTNTILQKNCLCQCLKILIDRSHYYNWKKTFRYKTLGMLVVINSISTNVRFTASAFYWN